MKFIIALLFTTICLVQGAAAETATTTQSTESIDNELTSLIVSIISSKLFLAIISAIGATVFARFFLPIVIEERRRTHDTVNLLNVIKTDIDAEIIGQETFELKREALWTSKPYYANDEAMADKGIYSDPFYYFNDPLMLSFFRDYQNEIHLIPNELMEPIYRFYASLQQSKALSLQFRQEEFKRMTVSRRYEAYQVWIDYLEKSHILGTKAQEKLAEYERPSWFRRVFCGDY